MRASAGNARTQLAARPIVSAPPATTAVTAPSTDAATPDSNAPSSFDALMKTISTASTRPREDRCERDRPAEEHREEVERDRPEQHRRAADEADAGEHALEAERVGDVALDRRHAHHQCADEPGGRQRGGRRIDDLRVDR